MFRARMVCFVESNCIMVPTIQRQELCQSTAGSGRTATTNILRVYMLLVVLNHVLLAAFIWNARVDWNPGINTFIPSVVATMHVQRPVRAPDLVTKVLTAT